MDPIEPNQIVQTQTQPSQTAESTFSAEVAKEDVLGNAAFESNSQVVSAHRKSTLFRFLWIALALLLLSLLGFVLYRSIKTTSTAKPTSSASNYNDTRINLTGFTSGSGVSAGQLAVNGSANIVTDLNVGGNANIGGTLTATNLQGDGTGIINLQASNITGVIGTGQLDPFIAYVNKDNQAFFGNGQVFRNASDSTAGFQIQNSASAPIFSINTEDSYLVVNESVASQNGLSFEVNGNGRFAGTLQVGEDSNPNASILNPGPLFSNDDIRRSLSVQQISSNNVGAANAIFVGSANELLANPQENPVNLDTFFGFTIVDQLNPGNKNIYAGSYSALQTDQNSTKDFYLNGGIMNGVTHTGSGTVFLQTAQLNSVSNIGVGGDVAYAFGSITVPITYNDTTEGPVPNGVMDYYSGNTIIDPQDTSLSFLGFPTIYEPGTIGRQVGLDIQYQQSGSLGSANIVSEGFASKNFFEGKVSIGSCAENLTPSSAIGTTLCFAAIPGGNKLSINDRTPSTASVHVNTAVSSDIALVVKGVASQTGDLTQWQDSTGAVQSVVTANGSVGIGTSTPGAFRLNTTDTSTTNVAQFNGSAGTQCTVVTGTGWSCSSDESLKTNILSVNNGLDVISQLRGVTYNWKSDPTGAQQDGFIAQEVQKILPQLVTTDATTGLLSLNKDGILPYLVNAIQDQQKQIDTLKGGSSTVASIDVLQQLADAKAVTFGGDVTINGNVVIKGTITGSADSRGKVTVATGATQSAHSFVGAYASQPYVQVTPLEQIDGAYWVSGNSTTGFTVQLEKPQATPVSFNWFVLN